MGMGRCGAFRGRRCREVPARLERLVLRALAEGEVTESRASELLAVPADALRTRLRCA